MVITIMVPYLYVWFIGLLASYEIAIVSKNVKGVLYRRALQLLGAGLVTIIVSSIALQYISGVSTHTTHIVFDYKLVVGVLFRIVGGAGFIMLALGALRLKRIEEV